MGEGREVGEVGEVGEAESSGGRRGGGAPPAARPVPRDVLWIEARVARLLGRDEHELAFRGIRDEADHALQLHLLVILVDCAGVGGGGGEGWRGRRVEGVEGAADEALIC